MTKEVVTQAAKPAKVNAEVAPKKVSTAKVEPVKKPVVRKAVVSKTVDKADTAPQTVEAPKVVVQSKGAEAAKAVDSAKKGPSVKKAPAAKKAAVEKKAKTVVAAKPEKPAKVKKPKLVRDSFTIPEADYALFDSIKKRLLVAGLESKKSEILRAALANLAKMTDSQLAKTIGLVERIKTGRPKK